MAIINVPSRKSGIYYVNWWHEGRQFNKSCKTKDESKAKLILRRVEDTLWKLENGVLEVPEHCNDVGRFILDGGIGPDAVSAAKPLALGELFKVYNDSLLPGAKEESTLRTEGIHQKRLMEVFGEDFLVGGLDLNAAERYSKERSKRNWHGKRITAYTIKKELKTLRKTLSWGFARDLIGKPPSWKPGEIDFPKDREKERFRTREEIERIIARGKLAEGATKALWEGLYLTGSEVRRLLSYVKERPGPRFVYPMFVFAACTGARRSELARSEVDDFDFANDSLRIEENGGEVSVREKKGEKGKTGSRRSVAIHPLLREVMLAWLAPENHPGGVRTLCLDDGSPITVDTATYYFKAALDGSEWQVIRGFHVLRHSFASILASKGVDQRIINKFMGHRTEEMQRRYQHLFPKLTKEAVKRLFEEN